VIDPLLLPIATSPQVGNDSADVAVLPVGSFEQHGPHLPLVTDTVIACAIAASIAEAYQLRLLAPLTYSCSHEHAAFPGTVSISPTTLIALVADIRADLDRAGVRHLVVINAHGGNYALANLVQQANVQRRAMLLYPGSADWTEARASAGCDTTTSDDMHAGEAETSFLLHVAPRLVDSAWADADWEAPSPRPLLTLLGIAGYSPTGVIGTPSHASANKGRRLLDALTAGFDRPLKELRSSPGD
jgi:creatinine amidohydrolase